MPSQFDQFMLPTSEFIQEYQGLPLAEVEKAGTALENTYLKNLTAMNQIDMLNADRRAIAGDAAKNKEIGEEYNAIIDKMAKEGDFEHMTMRMAGLASQYARDPRIKAINESRKNFEQEQELAQKMSAQGHTPLFMGDPTRHQSYNPETGEVNIYQPRVEAMLDYEGRMGKIWSDVNPDQSITGLSDKELQLLGEDADYYIKYGQWKGIGNKKITDQLDNAVNSYMITPEGKQQMKKYMSEGMTMDEAASAVRGDVLDRGQLRIFGLRDIQLRALPSEALKASNTGPTMPGYEEMAATHLKTDLGFDIDDFEHRDRSDIDDIDKTERMASVRSGTLSPSTKAKDVTSYTGPSKYITPEEQKAFDGAVSAGIELFGGPDVDPGNLTHEQEMDYARKYQDLVEDRLLTNTINTTDFNREYAERQLKKTDITQNDLQGRIEANIKNQLEQRTFYDIQSGVTFTMLGRDGEVSDQFKEFIGKPENIELAGELDPKNYVTVSAENEAFADAYVINARDFEKGNAKSRTVLVTRQKSSRDNIMGEKARMTNNIYTGFGTTPNQTKEMDLRLPNGRTVKLNGKKNVAVDNQGKMYDLNLMVSIEGGEPLMFNNEDQLAQFILQVEYGQRK